MSSRPPRMLVVALSGLACGDPAAREIADAGVDPASFAALHRDVIAPRCAASCHQRDADPPAGTHDLRLLDPDEAHAALVEVPSRRCPGLLRVAPGDPGASLLWRKVVPGVEACGFKMPPDCFGDACGLAAGDVERVRAWIAAGAPP